MFDLFGRRAKAENQLLQAINDGLRGVVWEQRDKIEALEGDIARRTAACRKGKINSDLAKAKKRAERAANTIAALPAALAVDVAA